MEFETLVPVTIGTIAPQCDLSYDWSSAVIVL